MVQGQALVSFRNTCTQTGNERVTIYRLLLSPIAGMVNRRPGKRSGLAVSRCDAPTLRGEFGAESHLLEQVNETHVTHWNTEQQPASPACHCMGAVRDESS